MPSNKEGMAKWKLLSHDFQSLNIKFAPDFKSEFAEDFFLKETVSCEPLLKPEQRVLQRKHETLKLFSSHRSHNTHSLDTQGICWYF